MTPQTEAQNDLNLPRYQLLLLASSDISKYFFATTSQVEIGFDLLKSFNHTAPSRFLPLLVFPLSA